MTFNDFAGVINQIQGLNNPFATEAFYKTPVKVMYNGNEYNFHLSVDQPGMVTFINADDETKDLLSLVAEVNEVKERIENLCQLDNYPDFYDMDHHYVVDYIKTIDGDKISSKIVFYISDSEKL